jgi:hypothetical protein
MTAIITAPLKRITLMMMATITVPLHSNYFDNDGYYHCPSWECRGLAITAIIVKVLVVKRGSNSSCHCQSNL